eukprot:m.150006 g.150006  ORF g.150006 m.150006 type:complete len:66 (-) comp14217_c0_seq1:37-234(-)
MASFLVHLVASLTKTHRQTLQIPSMPLTQTQHKCAADCYCTVTKAHACGWNADSFELECTQEMPT